MHQVVRHITVILVDLVAIATFYPLLVALRLENLEIQAFLSVEIIVVFWLAYFIAGLVAPTWKYSIRFFNDFIVTSLVKFFFVFLCLCLASLAIPFVEIAPRSLVILLPVSFFIFSIFFRLVAYFVLRPREKSSNDLGVVAIVGKSGSAIELYYQYLRDKGYSGIRLFDSSREWIGKYVGKSRVESLDAIGNKGFADIDLVVTAGPRWASLPPVITDKLQQLGIPVVESISGLDTIRLFNEKAHLSFAANVMQSHRGSSITDLTADNTVKEISGASIVVTGAAGSIGSGIVRFSLAQGASKVFAVDISEFGLWQLKQELESDKVIFVLCDAADNLSLEREIFQNSNIDFVFHCGAYKHVGLVENNKLYGFSNNVQATLGVLKAASRYRVKKFILVSSDKAVRPTSVMGISKRVCELLVVYYAQRFWELPCVKIVRFGNVLGSSGSILQIFRSQLTSGGPLTITHPEIVRYFMSLEEAVYLVVKTIELNSGILFHLDMGRPIKIVELAKSLIRLAGYEPIVKGQSNHLRVPNKSIEICFTGLQAGEKLYEELLVDGTSEESGVPGIVCVKEALDKVDDKVLDRLLGGIVNGEDDGFDWDQSVNETIEHLRYEES